MFEKITFSAVGTLVSFHSGEDSHPFPQDLLTQPRLDEFALSPNKRGIPPLFMNYKSVEIKADNNHKTISNLELIELQIKNAPDKLIYHLMTKVDLDFSKLIDQFFKVNPNYKNSDPLTAAAEASDEWLNWHCRDEFYKEGIEFLSELRAFDETSYVNEIVRKITNPLFGLRAFIETEITENTNKLNKKYSNHPEDIVILFQGKFNIDITINSSNSSELSFNAPSEIMSVYVRNYDEDYT